MVPIAGPAISAGVKTALRAQELYAGEAAEQQARRSAQSRYLQFVSALDARLTAAPFVVLVLTQAEWVDGASASLLDRIARLTRERALVVLVTYRLRMSAKATPFAPWSAGSASTALQGRRWS